MNKIIFTLTVVLVSWGIATGAANRDSDNGKTGFTPKAKPAGFVENKGQFRDQYGNPNPDVLYMADFGGMKVLLRKDGFSYETYEIKPKWVDPATIPYKIVTNLKIAIR